MAFGDAVVGALRVVLGLDTGQFEDDAKKAGNSFKGVADVFAGVGLERIVEKIFSAISHTIKAAIVDTIELGDKLGTMADRIGVSVAEFSGLRVAAEVSGISMDALAGSLSKLEKQMALAGRGSQDARDQFKALGVPLDNIAKANVIDVLVKISDKFGDSAGGAVKATAALKLFGDGSKELFDLLNQGGDSILKFTKTANDMGLVIGDVQKNQSKQFIENLKLIKLAGEGVANMLAAEFLPALVNLTNGLADSAKQGTAARNTADYISSSFKQLAVNVVTLYTTLVFLKDTFNEFGAATEEADKKTDKSLTGLAAWRQQLIAIKDALVAADQQTAILGQRGGTSFEKPTDKAAELQRRITDAVNALLNLIRIPPQINVTPGIKDLADVASKSQKEIERLTLQADVLNGKFSNMATGLPQLAASLGLVNRDASNLTPTLIANNKELSNLEMRLLNAQAAQQTFDLMTPFQTYQAQLIQLNLQHQVFIKTQGELGISTEQLAQRAGLAYAQLQKKSADAFAGIASSFAEMVGAFAGENKRAIAVVQSLQAAAALISAFGAAAQTLADPKTGGFPYNLAASAAVLAKGLAFVVAIKGVSGFATGGSFKVGGRGGIDSQMVTFKATPGEMVDVRRPDQTQPTQFNINLQGDRISRDQVRELFDTINQGMRDGYRLALVT